MCVQSLIQQLEQSPEQNEGGYDTKCLSTYSPEDCPMSPASFLIARLSLVNDLPGQVHGLTHENYKLQLGQGIDGAFSRSNGFINSGQSAVKLPAELRAWEQVHDLLPVTLRKGSVRALLDTLPPSQELWETISPIYLTRASMILSAFAHAYFYRDRKDENTSLPCHLEQAWLTVSERLGRPFAGRMVADDFLNNARTNAGQFKLVCASFSIPEETLSSGLQGFVEYSFTPAHGEIVNAQNYLLAKDNEGIIKCLRTIQATMIKCAGVLLELTPLSAKKGFDPIIWVKTYPAMGMPVREKESSNSGVDAPLFHALDAFLGREKQEGDLRAMQRNRRATFPRTLQLFLEALEKSEVSLRDYVKAANCEQLTTTFENTVQIYAWFLERHRVKAVGITGVSLGSGRHSTSSGVSRGKDGEPIRPDVMLSRQMKAGLRGRIGLCKIWQPARINVYERGASSTAVVLHLEDLLPAQPGDRVQIDLDGCTTRPYHNKPDEPTSDKSLRMYSIGDVDYTKNNGTLLTLHVGHGTGDAGRFWSAAKHDQCITMRLVPYPRFRAPSNTSLPLIMICQGSGIGPFVGFLKARLRMREQTEMGQMILMVGARKLMDISDLEWLIEVTKYLPLELVFGLSQEQGVTVSRGDCREVFAPCRITKLVQRKVRELLSLANGDGHVYVCGSTDFGIDVRRSLGLASKGKAGQLGRFHTPPAPIDWHHYHEDLFGSRMTIPERIITQSELVMHNSFDDCWTIIDGIVYDLTKYLAIHPGGSKVLMQSAGACADIEFYETHGGLLMQEIRGLLRPYAVGTFDGTNLKQGKNKVLDVVVRAQNTLAINTAFPADRDVPFYAYCDALLVFAEQGLEDCINAIARVDEEKSGQLRKLQKSLEPTFADLKTTSWDKLTQSTTADLKNSEDEVRKAYQTQVENLHDLLDELKISLSH